MTTRTGVGCRVLIDGAILDDGCIDWNAPPLPAVPQGVVAESGLQIVWGRTTTIDQPEPSSCSFVVIDEPGGSTVMDALRLGARVDVLADATIAPPGTLNAFTDPSFEVEVRGTTKNATLTRSQRRSEDVGGWAAALFPINAAQGSSAIMPPGTIQAYGTNPAAWVGIQTTQPGETWTIQARVYIPEGVAVRISPVLYSGPWESAATVLRDVTTTATGPGWTTAALSFAPGVTSAWVGVSIDASPGAAWDQIPAATTWDQIPAATTWDDYAEIFIDRIDALGPAAGSVTSVMVFSGRITDLEGGHDAEWNAPRMNVTASDFLADFGNRYIGSEPWTMEPVAARIDRILTLAARPGEPAITIEIAPAFGAVPMSWDDVDHQAASGLLTDVAQSVDGVLWTAVHPVVGPYLRLEDPTTRRAMQQLTLSDGVIVIVQIDFRATEQPPPPELSACDVLRDPVTFLKNVSDVATRASIGWELQTVDDEGNPATEGRTATAINTADESVYGTRSVSLSTLLTTEPEAIGVAERLIQRLAAAWRIGGIAVNDADVEPPDSTTAELFLTLLDGVTRGGQPLMITDLPDWSPVGAEAPVYVEGGNYTYSGGWNIDLFVSRGAGIGMVAKWDEIPNDPAWTWDAWDPGITWDQLRGVTGP